MRADGEGGRNIDRRRFLQRAGVAGATIGALAWAAPEILTVSPAAAATGTAPPIVNPPGPGGGTVGGGPTVLGVSAGGPTPPGPGAPSGPGKPAPGGPGGGAPGGETAAGPSVFGQTVSLPPRVAGAETPRGGLAFTGFNPKRLFEAAAALMATGAGLLTAAERRRLQTDEGKAGTRRPPGR
jgi:hypothetical protein